MLTHTHTHIYTCAQTHKLHMHTHTCTPTHMYMHTYIHTHAHTRAHSCTHTHTHTHTQSHNPLLPSLSTRRMDKDRKRTRQKVQQNEVEESPGIPDRGMDIRHPRLPFRTQRERVNQLISWSLTLSPDFSVYTETGTLHPPSWKKRRFSLSTKFWKSKCQQDSKCRFSMSKNVNKILKVKMSTRFQK